MATTIPDNRARFTLDALLRATGGRLVAGLAGERVAVLSADGIEGVVTDSRRVRPGCLYVALRGEHHDGHAFLAQAKAAGAAAALVSTTDGLPAGLAAVCVADVQHALGELGRAQRRRWDGRLIGITGSAGKTTTKELTATLLAAVAGAVARTEGNLNNLIGVPMTLLTLEAGVPRAVIELGTSARGEIARLAEITEPDVGVVTTVAVAHTAGIGSLEDVAVEKTALLRALPARGTAIYNVDNAALSAQVGPAVVAARLRFGCAADAELRLEAHELTREGRTRCRFVTPAGALEAELPLLGIGPALDLAAALAVVWTEHGSRAALEQACAALSQVRPVAGRLVPRPHRSGALLLDDTYNANPASTEASLQTLAALARARGGRALAVLGDMKELGSEAAAAHRRVGELCVELGLSQLVACGDEMGRAAVAARAAGIAAAQIGDALEATSVLTRLEPGDVLLVKGSRSMAMERLVEALVGGSP